MSINRYAHSEPKTNGVVKLYRALEAMNIKRLVENPIIYRELTYLSSILKIKKEDAKNDIIEILFNTYN